MPLEKPECVQCTFLQNQDWLEGVPPKKNSDFYYGAVNKNILHGYGHYSYIYPNEEQKTTEGKFTY